MSPTTHGMSVWASPVAWSTSAGVALPDVWPALAHAKKTRANARSRPLPPSPTTSTAQYY
jgi:hypothetical protein